MAVSSSPSSVLEATLLEATLLDAASSSSLVMFESVVVVGGGIRLTVAVRRSVVMVLVLAAANLLLAADSGRDNQNDRVGELPGLQQRGLNNGAIATTGRGCCAAIFSPPPWPTQRTA